MSETVTTIVQECERMRTIEWPICSQHVISARVIYDGADWPIGLDFISTGAPDCEACARACVQMRAELGDETATQELAESHRFCQSLLIEEEAQERRFRQLMERYGPPQGQGVGM